MQTVVAHPPIIPIEPKNHTMETFANLATDLANENISTKKVRVELKDNISGSGIVRRLVPPTPPSEQSKQEQSLSLPSSLSDEWLTCNLCKCKTLATYIGKHLKLHIPEYVIKTTAQSSTALAKVEEKESSLSANSLDAIILAHMSGGGSSERQTNKVNMPTLAAQEFYRFKTLDAASAVSSVSKDGRYSDFTTTFFFKERTTVNSTSYMGGHAYTTKEAERLTVHVVYDNLEDYYTISTQLLKRSNYSSWDSEDTVPDRICYQSELMLEIKKAMLYFAVPPRTAYKIWRKLFRQNIVIEYDKNNRAIAAQTQNYTALIEKLKPDTTIYHKSRDSDDYYGAC